MGNILPVKKKEGTLWGRKKRKGGETHSGTKKMTCRQGKKAVVLESSYLPNFEERRGAIAGKNPEERRETSPEGD